MPFYALRLPEHCEAMEGYFQLSLDIRSHYSFLIYRDFISPIDTLAHRYINFFKLYKLYKLNFLSLQSKIKCGKI